MTLAEEITAQGWQRVDPPDDFVAQWRGSNPDVDPPLIFQRGDLRALVGREPIDPDWEDVRWHVSISRPDRLPGWDDVVMAAHTLRPGVVFVIAVPPRSWWINVHPYVLHLHEVRDTNLVEQWRAERRGDRPT